MNTTCHVVIPCAGTGSRIGGEVPKQFKNLGSEPIVNYCLKIFLNMPTIQTVWVGVSDAIFNNPKLMGKFPKHPKLRLCKTGGQTRALTVLNTLNYILSGQDGHISPDDWVLVHDAARPGIKAVYIEKLIQQVQFSGLSGGILALPLADTLKKSVSQNQLNVTNTTVDRSELWLAQTPQMFKIHALANAIESAIELSHEITDEASAMENSGHSVLLVQGDNQNFKVTYPEDLNHMEHLLTANPFRVGQGYDVHQLVENRPLILGGIHIPYEKGLLGHSDADALLHAIIDALLGAAALGDIGQHFPDTDPQFKGVDSGFLLQRAYEKVLESGYELINLDATIICQKPKLMPYLHKMTQQIAGLLKMDEKQINLKAKTNEGLGYLGESQAIETQAIVLISKIK